MTITIGGVAVTASGTPTNGQVLAYNSGTGLYVPTNPSGASELAYAENNTGVGQSGINSNSATPVTGCTIVVPASARPVYLSGSLSFAPTAISGFAAVRAQIIETSNGIDTPVTISAWATLPTDFAGGGSTIPIGPCRLASSTANTRTFVLNLLPSTSDTITILNGTYTDRSWIAAEAR